MNILNEWKNSIDCHLKKIKHLINKSKLIANEFDKSRQDVFEVGFNAFTLVSDLYRRENFHSDVIKALLDPKEKHKQKEKYLYLFIDLLNKLHPAHFIIDKNNFQNTIVLREKQDIDILIKDETSKKAIIIENKINNAADTYRQLPKYYERVRLEYEVQAIVYLPLDASKKPNKTDWTEDEIAQINKLLIIIPAYEKKSRPNLYEHWIVPSMLETQDIDSLFLLKQYGNLLKFLNTNNMDKISLEKFYETLKEEDNFKTSISIKNMLNDLPEYLAIRIEDKYKNHCYPFKSIWRYKGRDTVFDGFELGDLYFKLDIWCWEDGYTVYFWEQNHKDCEIKDIFQDIEVLNDFKYHSDSKNSTVKRFNLFDEEILFDFIDNLLSALKNKKIIHK